MTSAEFGEWLAFANIEPFGSHVEDRRAGAAVSMLANINRDTKRHPDPFDDLFFMPWNDRNRQQAEQQVAVGDIFIEDPDKMSALIAATLFGEAPQAKDDHGEAHAGDEPGQPEVADPAAGDGGV